MSAASFVTSSSVAAGPSCTNLFIDVGANNGNSLRFWFNPTDSGHGMAEYARIERAEERKSYCADVFEANPHFNEQLSRLVRKYRSQGRSVRLFNGTAFSVGGGPVAFGVDPANTISSSLVRTKHVRGKTAWLSNYSISVPSVDAIKYIRSLQGYNRVVLKVDVEGYEFELLRALLASGALCSSAVSDLLLEWHTLRPSGPLFDAKAEGMPIPPDDLKAALLWMTQSPVCRRLKVHQWW